jgi:CRISPR-associated endonuclease/helicase Cas3
LSGREEAEKAAQTALLEGKRVLWVVNTVARCQELARSFEQSLCYHSRFRLCDRKNRHGEVIQAFRAGARPAQDVLAITTQVCEMSLDLDADVLITETAPITALIQRMGCCCRSKRFGDGSDRMGEVLIYSAPAEAPYASEELSGVPAFLEALDGQEVSQARLEELLERHGEAAPEPGLYAAFLESGPWAESREASLREESDFTVQAVLDTDVPEYLLLRKCHKPWDGLLTPAPKNSPGDIPNWDFGP